MAQTGKRSVLLTPKFRVSFPEVFQKRQFDESQKARYSVVALFTPSEFTETDKVKWQAILKRCNEVAIDGFKKPLKALDRGLYKNPFHKGEEKSYAGYGPGIVFFTMASTKRRPGIVDRLGNPITQDGDEEFYAGCWARASCNPYWFNNKGKGVAIGLGNLQKLGDGERLDAFTSAEQDFGDDPAEYGGDDDMGMGDTDADFDPAS